MGIGNRPRANDKARMPRKVHATARLMLGIRSMSVECTGIVIGDLMFPQSERVFLAGFRRDFKTSVPQHPRTGEFMRVMDRFILHDIPGHVFAPRSEEHTSELQSLAYLVCRLLL